MSTDDLIYMSATEAAQRFREKTLSPVELLEGLIERFESVSETVNPFADCYFEEARVRAQTSEAAFSKNDHPLPPLEGIPLAVKDTGRITGQRSTVGSLIYKDHIHDVTDPSIQRLLDAGANVFARTTCPEFGWLFTTQSRMWGVTHNPWQHGVSPGGSSGGAAAALAAGATTLATGGDTTGSIRQPASQCGIVGYQAPYGRIPIVGDSSFNDYSHPGPMTRTLSDCALMANLMSGPSPLDHNSIVDRIHIPDEVPDLTGVRIAVSIDLGFYEIAEDVRRETGLALDALRDAGAVIEEVDVDWAKETTHFALGAQEFLFAGYLNEIIAQHGDIVSDYVPQLAETANSYTADDYRRSKTIAGEVWRDHLGPLFQHYDAFIMPTTTCPKIPASGWQKDTITVNGKQVTDTQTSMTVLWNMFSRCPVLAVPSGMTDGNLPTGIQIVSRPYDDPSVFRIARALEDRRPWLDVPERRPKLS
jgi:Asp-tRNA(Asn)/Glu-tRNA(Gln) amidotransferase A subunit family amidase